MLLQSALRAIVGLSCAARRAGIQQARSATTSSASAVIAEDGRIARADAVQHRPDQPAAGKRPIRPTAIPAERHQPALSHDLTRDAAGLRAECQPHADLARPLADDV